jgi:MYXO-CTERM domain-containing protein
MNRPTRSAFLPCLLLCAMLAPHAADARTIALEAPSGSCVTLAGDVYARVITLLQGRGHTVTVVQAADIDTAQKIAQYDAIVFGGGAFACPWDWAGFDPVLQAYVNGGGGLVVTGWGAYYMASNTHGNEVYAGLEAVLPMLKGTQLASGTQSLTPVQGHAITNGLAAFANAQYDNYGGGRRSGSTLLLTDGGTDAAAAWTLGAGRAVYLGPIYLANWGGYDNEALLDGSEPDAQELFLRAVEWAAFGLDASPEITASTGALAYGDVTLGANASQSVTLTSSGGNPLQITAIGVTGTDAADFTVTAAPTLPANLPVMSQASVTVKFAPGGPGARQASLVIASNAANAPQLTITLTGNGLGAVIGASPSPLDFGSANVATAAQAQLTVANTGNQLLTVSALAFSGANAADFATTQSLPLTVAAGTSALVPLSFTPAALGARAGKLTITSDDPRTPALDVALSGTGTAPDLGVAPSSVAFGAVRITTTSSAKTVTLTNNGTGPATVTSASLSGPNAARFALTAPTLPAALAATQSLVLSLEYSPTAVAADTATLTIVTDDPAHLTIAVPITGTGASSQIGLSPLTIDFGSQLVGRASVTHTVTVHNAGALPLNVSALAMAGANASAFALVSPPTLPTAVAAGESQALTLVFTPSIIGEHAGALVVTSDDPASPAATVTLAGTGVSELLSVSPLSLDFGTVTAPGVAGPKSVVVTNLGGDPLTLVEAAIAGSTPAAFNATSASGILAPGATRSVDVTFSPSAAGDFAATLTIESTDTTVPKATVGLTGKATAAPQTDGGAAHDTGVDGGNGTAGGGCGCTTARQPTATLALLAVLLGVMLRRRHGR